MCIYIYIYVCIYHLFQTSWNKFRTKQIYSTLASSWVWSGIDRNARSLLNFGRFHGFSDIANLNWSAEEYTPFDGKKWVK